MKNWAILVVGLLATLSMPAEAHPGHGVAFDFQTGLWHPLLGADHVLVMIGAGLWAAWLGGAARLWLPAAFLAAMAGGAALAFAGFAVPNPEVAVSASVAAIGLILAFGMRFGTASAAGVAALFALSHGYVHALEAAADSQALYYAGGFSVATALLVGAGLLLGGFSLRNGRWIKTAFGVICAASGIGLLIGV